MPKTLGELGGITWEEQQQLQNSYPRQRINPAFPVEQPRFPTVPSTAVSSMTQAVPPAWNQKAPWPMPPAWNPLRPPGSQTVRVAPHINPVMPPSYAPEPDWWAAWQPLKGR